MIISIVGKSGSGKSYITKLLTNYSSNIVNLNIDKIGHLVLEIECVKEKLIDAFGENIVTNKKVDRKKLGNIVFKSNEEMEKLTNITWPYMEKLIDKFIEKNSNKIIILDWLLISKTKYFWISDIRILVTAPFDVRLKRAMSRDNITELDFIKREQSSIDFNSDDFDYIIDNQNIDDTRKRVEKIYDKSIISR